MQEAGLAVPTLKTQADFFTITFDLPLTIARSTKGSSSGETLRKTPDLILLWLAEAPGAFIPVLAKHLGKSDSAIERAIRKLRVDGKLIRIGPAKGGQWQVRQ